MELSRRICAAFEGFGASDSVLRGEVDNTVPELCFWLRVRSGVAMDGWRRDTADVVGLS